MSTTKVQPTFLADVEETKVNPWDRKVIPTVFPTTPFSSPPAYFQNNGFVANSLQQTEGKKSFVTCWWKFQPIICILLGAFGAWIILTLMPHKVCDCGAAFPEPTLKPLKQDNEFTQHHTAATVQHQATFNEKHTKRIKESTATTRATDCPTTTSFTCSFEISEYRSTDVTNATDCFDLKNQHNMNQSGIYYIYPPGLGQLTVYCDMETYGGGWTVFQRRLDNSLTFEDKTWKEYKNGFNNGLNYNLWLGNDNIHVLSTKDAKVDLRVDLCGDRSPCSPDEDGYWFGIYPSFWIDNEENFYTLHFDINLIGNSSDPNSNGNTRILHDNIGKQFSTIDVTHAQDNYNCSKNQFGGWWPRQCSFFSLNGKYIPKQWSNTHGFSWYKDGSSYAINPAQSIMSLRKVP